MIQELLAGSGSALVGGGGERSISVGGGVLEPEPKPKPCPRASPSPSPSPSGSAPPESSSADTAAAYDNQNLRCPRCNSTNTKFCYYNNYNLTQPRHFCKTCRRYWTKGGALRNVPIGGGCRKNRNNGIPPSVPKSAAAKLKSLPQDLGRSALPIGFDHELAASPVLWASPQSSQLLAMLRSAQNPNPTPIPVKQEGGATVMTQPLPANDQFHAPLNLHPPSLDLCSSLWRTNQHQPQQHRQSEPLFGDLHNAGLHELYHRLRSTSTYCNDLSPGLLGNLVSSSSSSPSVLDSAPLPAAELGYWNPTFSWSDLSTSNGAYP